jgi:hypothetical protein
VYYILCRTLFSSSFIDSLSGVSGDLQVSLASLFQWHKYHLALTLGNGIEIVEEKLVAL